MDGTWYRLPLKASRLAPAAIREVVRLSSAVDLSPQLSEPRGTALRSTADSSLAARATMSWIESDALNGDPRWARLVRPAASAVGLNALPPVAHLALASCVASFVLQRLSSTVSPTPVSYTHLTLPTIYSV